MSDPVTNVEIEDVLSSIRRLVSADTGRTKRKPAPRKTDPSPAASEGKLVLTEDLRIPPTPELVSQEQLKDLDEDYTKTLERRIAELEAAVTAQSTEFEPDGSEDTAQHRPTSVLFPAKPAHSDGVLELDALIETAVHVEPAEPDAPMDDEAPMWDDRQGLPNDEQVQSKADNDQTSADLSASDLDDDHMWSDHEAREAEDGVEILEAESHQKDAQKKADQEFVFSSEDAVIDEEALRDMVAEIVREELQGALGERITRNVRKLVRREIMRAISIRDFE